MFWKTKAEKQVRTASTQGTPVRKSRILSPEEQRTIYLNTSTITGATDAINNRIPRVGDENFYTDDTEAEEAYFLGYSTKIRTEPKTLPRTILLTSIGILLTSIYLFNLLVFIVTL